MSVRVKYRSVIDWRTLKRNKWPPLQRNSGELCPGITGDLCSGIVAYYRAEYPANVEGSARGETTRYTPGYIRGHIKYRETHPARKQPQGQVAQTLTRQQELAMIMVNLTWNSNDWQRPSVDKSGHRWVNEGNIPVESWNFDFENKRNPVDKVYGFAQFRAAPILENANKIIIIALGSLSEQIHLSLSV